MFFRSIIDRFASPATTVDHYAPLLSQLCDRPASSLTRRPHTTGGPSRPSSARRPARRPTPAVTALSSSSAHPSTDRATGCRCVAPLGRRPVVLPMAAPIRAATVLPLEAIAPRHMVPAAALRLFQWLHHIARCRCVAHSGRSAAACGQAPHRGRPLQAVPEAAPTLALPLRRPVRP